MKETAVLRVPRADDEDAYVLIQVISSGRNGLDFDLAATEGGHPYLLKLRHDKVSSKKDKKHPIAEDEWERILTEVLLDRQSDPDIELVAQVAEGQSIALIVRRSISGIKQRIGTINLLCDEDQGLDLFDWCGTALASKKAIKADLEAANAKAQELENAVKELKDQLEELIEAKKADESELLVKFRDLLNEKKVKIREQQRLLMANNADPEETNAVPSPRRVARQTGKGHVPKPSRTSKRKAAEPEPEEEPVLVPAGEDEDEDDELEKMEVDKKHGEEDSEEDRTTDAGDDDETGSEPDDDDDEPVLDRGRATRNIDKPPAANTRHASQRKVETPPPPRALPFNQRKAAAKPAADPEPEGSETESDDEL
ncbi:hypothetical protein CONLIGDRAFT_431423 [Coniochaeta ligniaria NRRL 30616]|uniref:XRCC4 coiled-coil domain-containing protein n=1 Tax=Coniochaeta ligniaria NRRL 30616 TaxID=1408157 RepID=A0A1J7IJ17_9PEZI|nr:hypothetical protein CONLIGDRAFT_431423 [Coniochaeta ligniaria NRRL 30616]